MDNKNNKRGFSGISDLTSEVNGTPQNVPPKKSELIKNSPPVKESSPVKKPSSQNESEKQSKTSNQPVETISHRKNLGNTGGKWILGIIAVIIIWILFDVEGTRQKSSFNSQTPSTSYNDKQIDPTPDVKNSSNNQSIRLKYKKPLAPKTSASGKPKSSDEIKRIEELREGLTKSGDHFELLKEIEKGGHPLDFNGACQLQEILRYLCLYRGKIDGIIGPRSKKAIKDLIEKENLKIKNNIDTNLLDFLKENHLSKPSLCSSTRQPENGYVFLSSGENIAPLQISIPNYGKDFFVKLVNPYTNQSVKEFFIRSGQTVKTDVPLGTFHLKYAAGNIWIGKYNLFGLDTVYSKTNKEFSFHQLGDQVNGYTVELILRAGGNLRTSKIDSKDF
jgi:hypothetical protein